MAAPFDVRVSVDEAAAALAAAEIIAAEARAAVAARGRFSLAVSGGRTPWLMLGELADQDVPWDKLLVIQIDERAAPAGSRDRNLSHLQESLLVRVALRPEQVLAMPVEGPDLDAAAIDYAKSLAKALGPKPALDLVHLGLGPDGHTASLVPGDAVLEVRHADVAATSTAYQGHRRMTLTYPMLDRARCLLWLATGEAKRPMLARLLAQDASIPAGRVPARRNLLVVDEAAWGDRT